MCYTDETYFFSQRQRIQLNKQINIEGVVNDVINQLYNDRKIDKKTKTELIKSHYEPLKQAVNEGYNVKVEYGTPNYDFLQQLQTNAAVFAAFKAHAQAKEIAALLKDANGNLRSKEDFKTEALKVDANYKGSYLNAEYDMAVRQARAAVQWQKIQKQKKLYPNLKYMPSVSAHPREAHRAFYGIVRPVDDSFWNTHFPPIGWGCKCRVEQVDEDVTDIPNNTPKLEPEFDFNAGKDAKVFDVEKSQYAKSVTSKEKPALIKEAAALLAFDEYKDAPYTTIYTSKTGTEIQTHPLSNLADDYEQNLKDLRDFANSKLPVKNIKVAPYLNKYEQLRTELLPNSKGLHNPDAIVDNVYCDIKKPAEDKASKNTIKHTISNANEQANGIILMIEKDNYIDKNVLMNEIRKKYIHDAYKDFVMYVKHQNEWMMFKGRNDFMKQYKAQKKP
ncbi:MAG: phage minor head protein [Bacteroidetes bacterium]|nr:phage minor head protein [Bacteroidota bacterium]